ncbi:GNAT family N-acetyltransferase [Pseudomonas sp. R2.Fl]|nr:GNAT family N-acetyltransferase [Pseudomonas sp. R2.Fl]
MIAGDILIRIATPQDVAFLPDVEQAASQSFRQIPHLAWIAEADNLPVEFHERQIAAHRTWVAAGRSDRPVGFITVEPHGDMLHIVELSVAAEFQGRGIGRALIDHVVRHARNHSFSAVTLTTFREIAWNAPFYQRFGFEALAERDLDEFLLDCIEREEKAGFQRAERCVMSMKLG